MESLIKLILHEWVRRIWIIALCAVLCFIGVYYYTVNNTKPTYSTTMKVSTMSDLRDSENTITAGSFINEMTLSNRRVILYMELFNTTSFYSRIAQVSGTGYSAGAVRSMLSFRQVEDMGFFYVTVTGANADHVYNIARAVEQEMFPYIDEQQPYAAITVVEPCTKPSSPINPPAKNNAFKGALIGTVLVMALFAAIAYFDSHIKDEESLTERYDIPILGSIPDFTAVTSKKKK